jgi:lysophospholipase L1-like esterase
MRAKPPAIFVSCLFLTLCLSAALTVSTTAATPPPPGSAPEAAPTLFIAGDSTAAVNSATQKGWGIGFQDYFDQAKLKIVNCAVSGRSSRTFISGGSWDRIVSSLKPNDYVIIQFGHNDNGPMGAFRFRSTISSLGDETQEANNAQGQPETVHSFGWYMRQMINDVKAKNANPIVVSMTVRGEWTEGKVERGFGDYARLAGELSKAEGVRYIDLTNIVADQYQEMGPEKVQSLFSRDTTHTNRAGADINAHAVIAGIKALHEYALINALTEKGRAIEVSSPVYVAAPKLAVPMRAAPDIFNRWLNLPDVPDPKLPTIFLIGDSTVRNGRDDGVDRQWGWGDALGVYLDNTKVNLVNRAVGGATAGSFYNTRWLAVQDLIKAGDFVLIQFGTNSEAQQPYTDNLHKYIVDTKTKGATPIVCTLVPRNGWNNGKFARNDPHVAWATTVAKDDQVQLLDLNNLVADQYDVIGREATTALFESGPHTNRKGAELTAKTVADNLRTLPETPLAKYFREKPATNW